MNTNTHVWSHLTQFCLEWEMFQTKFVDKIKTNILRSKSLFRKSCVYEIMWENIVKPTGHSWQCGACALRAGYLRLQTHTQNTLILIDFPLQQWLCERASILRNMYITCLIETKMTGYSTSSIWFLTVQAEMTSSQYDNIKPTELPEFCVSWLCSWQSCCTKNREDSKCARIWQIRSSRSALGLDGVACWASRVILWTVLLNSIHWLVFVMDSRCVFCEITTD